jgi:hypothetical protein
MGIARRKTFPDAVFALRQEIAAEATRQIGAVALNDRYQSTRQWHLMIETRALRTR